MRRKMRRRKRRRRKMMMRRRRRRGKRGRVRGRTQAKVLLPPNTRWRAIVTLERMLQEGEGEGEGDRTKR